MALFQTRREQENKQIQADVEEDEQQLQRCKFDGLVFVTQTGKQNGLESVQGHDDGHDFHKLGVVGIMQGVGNRFQENADQNDKNQTHQTDR